MSKAGADIKEMMRCTGLSRQYVVSLRHMAKVAGHVFPDLARGHYYQIVDLSLQGLSVKQISEEIGVGRASVEKARRKAVTRGDLQPRKPSTKYGVTIGKLSDALAGYDSDVIAAMVAEVPDGGTIAEMLAETFADLYFEQNESERRHAEKDNRANDSAGETRGRPAEASSCGVCSV